MAGIETGKFWVDLLKKVAAIVLKRASPDRPVKKHQHVVPCDEGWAVKGAGNKTYTAVFDTQEKAIARARRLARQYGTDVVIHRRDGSIRDRVSP